MKRLRTLLSAALLAALVLGPWSLGISAAVVTGTIVDTTGTALVTTVVFTPLSNPQADGGIVITAGPKSVTTGTNGTFSVTLEQGDYTVLIRGRDQFTIAVPNDSTTNNIVNLTTDSLSYVYSAPVSDYPVATASVNGGVKTDTTAGDPVVYLSSTVDTLLEDYTLLTQLTTASNALQTAIGTISTDGFIAKTNGTAVNLTGSLTDVTMLGTSGISGPLSVGGVTLSTNELSYLDGATGNLQSQISAISTDGFVATSAGTSTNQTAKAAFLIPFTSLRVFGDSTSDAASDWPGLLATDWGVTVDNEAVAGYYLYDMVNRAFTNSVATNEAVAFQCCVNNSKIETTAHYNAWSNALAAVIAFHTIPDSRKLWADDSTVTYTGTWATDSRWSGRGKISTTQSSTVQFTNYGTAIYIATRQTNVLGGSEFSVTIDGVLQGTYAANGGSAAAAGAMLLRFGGLSETAHTVLLTVTSATSVANPVWFDWAAGNLGHNTDKGPYFWLSTTSRRTPAAYSADGGSDTSVATQNRIARDLVDQFKADGLSVQLVDIAAVYDPNISGDSSDGTHPTSTGARKMANTFEAEMVGNLFSRDRRSAPTFDLLPVSRGGTGARTLTGLVVGSGTSAFTAVTAPSGTVVGTSDTQTLTAKTVSENAAVSPDDTLEGNVIAGRVNSGGVTQWDAVYLNSSGQWELADADGSGTYPAVGLAVATASTGAATTVVTRGVVRNDAWAWAPGAAVYLSTTAGGLTQTAPTGASAVVQVIGVAVTSDVIALNVTGRADAAVRPVAGGGTGATTLTGLIQGNGTSAFTAVTAPGGSLVGTTERQTLTAKTLSEAADISFDDTAEGNVLTGRVNSGGVTQWDAVYLNSSGQWVLADADGSGTYPALGLATATASTGASTTVVTRGVVRNDGWSWAPGFPIYLSTTAGGITQTAPTGTSAQVQAIGVALTSTRIYLNATGTYGPAASRVALIDTANSWADGVKQTFNPSSTTAGMNFGAVSGSPSSLTDGDVWLDSSGSPAVRVRVNGATSALSTKDDTMPTTSTLSYSGTSVTLTAGGRREYSHTLIVTNAFTLNISGATDGDRGIILCWPAVTTNCAVTLTSPARAPSGGITVTAAGSASAYTNYTAIAWQVQTFQGTNIITANGVNYQ